MKIYIEKKEDLRFIPLAEKGDSVIICNPLEIDSTLNIPANVGLICDKEITISDYFTWSEGVVIGDSIKNTSDCEFKIKIKKKSVDWNSGNVVVGVKAINFSDCYVEIKEVSGFIDGISLVGNNLGLQYNRIDLGLLLNNHVPLSLYSTNGGWVNENSFYGGRFTNHSNIHPELNRAGVVIESDYGYLNNSNKFINPCFELNVGNYDNVETTPILINNGKLNSFSGVRIEKCKSILPQVLSDDNSVDNFVDIQYSDLGDKEIVENYGDYIGVSANYLDYRRSNQNYLKHFENAVSNYSVRFKLHGCREFQLATLVNGENYGRRLFKMYDTSGVIIDNTAGDLIKANEGRPYYSENDQGWKTGVNSSTKKRYWVDSSVSEIEIVFGFGIELKSIGINFKVFNNLVEEVI